MIRRFLPILAGLGIVLAFLLTLAFLGWKSMEPEVVYETETPFMADVVLKTVATGAIVPRTEVAIKARVSGVVNKLFVEPGEIVEAGDLIASVKIIPDMVTLNSAQSRVQSARIERDNASAERKRAEQLFAQGAISAAERDRVLVTSDLRSHEFDSATSNLQLVADGVSHRTGNVSTQVRSTVAGMVLAVDVKSGESVIESNTFNEGTTIALVADMTDMIFEGSVDESEVGKIREGMALDVVVGAIEDTRFQGTLEYISPRGIVEQGAVQFAIKAQIQAEGDVFIRAGSSANADIVLDRVDEVLVVREAVLQFEDGQAFVEVETAPQQFERRDVVVGLSDGINIQVMSGVSEADSIKRS
jgi:HlyD family secretion protein